MASWNDGYVTEITYTHGYYAELNPMRIPLALTNNKLASPKNIKNACELGFGQGLSSLIHAAAQQKTTYWGTDFNPSQAAYARSIAEAAGIQCHLFDKSFEEFCQREDLPDFEFIGLHGIWSWISDQNRAIIVDFIRRKLAVGGVVYISYNTLPGWAAAMPLRHLLSTYAHRMHGEGCGVLKKIDGAIEFVDKLAAVKPGYLNSNPDVLRRFERIKGQAKEYLAHEYFNRDWEPMHFATMESWLQDSKVSFACSSHLADQIEALNLSPEQAALLKDVSDPSMRQSVRDMMVNQQFRRDYWIKGPNVQNRRENFESFRDLRFVLIRTPSTVDYSVVGARGKLELHKNIYEPLINMMADYSPRTMGQMVPEGSRGDEALKLQYREACIILVANNVLALVQDDSSQKASIDSVKRLNKLFIGMARGQTPVHCLASPVHGGAVAVDKVEQVYLLAMQSGFTSAPEIVKFTWEVLREQGVLLVREGKTLESPEDNLAELGRLIPEFLSTKYVMLRKLHVVD